MIQTVALVGHAQSGKTTLAEALLYKTGAKDRMGRVEDGTTTTTDYTPEAKLHRTTVRTGVAPLPYKEHRIFLLDAPGYGDFVGEIRGALEAADAALVAVSAENGVQGPGPWPSAWAFPGWWWSPSWTRAGTTTPFYLTSGAP
jgi:elongation factor G